MRGRVRVYCMYACVRSMHGMHDMQSGAELFPSTVSCMHACSAHMLCTHIMHAYHAYSARMHTYNTYARKNQRRSSKIKPRPQMGGAKRPPAPPEAGPLWSGLDFVQVSRVFARAGACMCVVCIHACGVCMVCMHAYYACIMRMRSMHA